MTKQDEPKTLVYHTKLAGVTFEGRQDVIKTLRGKEPLRVRRERGGIDPEVKHKDPKAVAVDVYLGDEWLPIGYIAKDKNDDISAAMDAGESVYIQMGGVTGGENGKSFGVNISLEYKMASEEEKTEEPVVTKKEAARVLEYLLKTLGVKAEAAIEAPLVYVSPLTGESIEIQEVNGHRRLEGYTSGSSFPDRFYPPFDKEGILQGIVDKFGVDAELVAAMWELNNEASTGYGTVVHAALENYDRNFELGDKIKKVEVLKTKTKVGPNKALSSNPFLKYLVESFHNEFGGDYERLSEVFVWDEGLKLCGSIDRLQVIDRKKKIVRIQDFKTDGDIHGDKYPNADSPFKGIGKKALKEGKKEKPNTVENTLLGLHWLQLSFYAFILSLKGWKVEGLDIFWLNPNKLVSGEQPWEKFSHEVIDISEQVING